MGNKANYQKIMEDTIAGLGDGEEPSLLLHSCCGPCSTYVLEYLSDYFNILVYYYNPNIYPSEEYHMRAEEQKRFIEEFNKKTEHSVGFEEGEYNREAFYEIARCREAEPERGERCLLCYRMRLSEAARRAAALGMDFVCTTLSISPMKDASALNEIGEEVAREAGVKYLFSDCKKKGGFLRSTELSKEYGMYRQDYCGCEFSYRDRHAK